MKARSFALGAALVALVSLPVLGCEDDHDHDHDSGEHAHGEMPESCEAFHDDCVKVMKNNAKAAECDEFSHGAGRTEVECAAKKDECVIACTGGDAGG